ncbi:MAG: phosphotransferase [Anaerolineae bacterium]|nr:phosphotransferase [Anaerolineae bacterium]
MSIRDDYLETIRGVYPDLDVRTASLNRQGQNADVLIVNQTLIFRFPRYEGGVAQLQMEVAILRGLAGRLPLPVPEPQYVHLSDQPPGDAFVAYHMLPGQPLWPHVVDDIADPARVAALAEQLGVFLKALHTVPYAEVMNCPLANADTHQSFRTFYRRVRQELFEWMRPRARERVERLFTSYLADASHFAFEPVLRHGDFGGSNILHDPRTLTLTGIIDFGSAAVGDPAYDVAGLLASYGEAFLDQVVVAYPEIASFMERVVFYERTFALDEALFGIENDDEAAFRAGMESYI